MNQTIQMTRKWNIVNDQLNANYDAGNEITYNVEVLKCYLGDCNNAIILVIGGFAIQGLN